MRKYCRVKETSRAKSVRHEDSNKIAVVLSISAHSQPKQKLTRLRWRFAWKEEHDRRDREKRETFVATHVMFADACCIVKRRS